MAGRKTVEVPYSNVKEALAEVLKKYAYIGDVTKKTDQPNLFVELIYTNGRPSLTQVERLSKPGLRRYAGVSDLEKIKQALGYVIISTPKGLMTHIEAKKKRLGGELICKIW